MVRDAASPPMPWLGRRKFGLSLAAAAAGLACPGLNLAAWAAEGAGLAAEIKAIKDRGTLIVGMTSFDSPPFYYTPRKDVASPKSDAFEGWDVKLASDIADVLDVKLTIDRQASAYSAVVDLVAREAVDVAISKLSMTPRRAMMVQFTAPTIELRHALLANRTALAKKSVDGDAKSVISHAFDGSLGVIAKSFYAETAGKVFPKASLHEFGTWDEVVEAVDHGVVDLAYRDELEVKKLMRLRPELHLNMRSVLITDMRDSIAVAVPKGSRQLLSVINVMLAQRGKFDANQLLDRYSNIFQAA